jgi:predicted AlkP superfamily phosphohydrolase/phosphomutase
MLLGHLGRNPLLADLILLAGYVLAYSLFFTLVSRGARPRGREAVFLTGIYLFGLFGWYLPARGITWAAVATSGLVLPLVWIGSRRWDAFGPVARFLPRPRALNLMTPLLLLGLLGAIMWERWVRMAPGSARTAFRSSSPGALQSAGVTLIGADGIDWTVLNELVSEGRLPNMRRLMEQSSIAPLETFSAKSPLIWTSVATGVSPEAHGVVDFAWPYLKGTDWFLPHSRFDFLGKTAARALPYREMRPFSSSNRKARAIWEIASLLGRKALVVNWWATYPAEALNGAIISDYSFPSERIDRVELEKLSRIGGVAFPEPAQKVAFRTMVDFLGDRQISISNDPEVPATERNSFFVVRDHLASKVFHAFDDRSFDLRLLFLNAVDAPSHIYTFDVFGGNVDEIRAPRVPPEKAEALWEELVVDAYLRLDKEVGMVLTQVPEEDYLVIVSDHGWRYDGTSHWRMPDGVLVLRGPGIPQGQRLPRAHVYDVFPTICYLLGLPISEDGEGDVVWHAFASEFVRQHPVQSIKSYGARSLRDLPFAPELDRDHLERLRSLGYLQ